MGWPGRSPAQRHSLLRAAPGYLFDGAHLGDEEGRPVSPPHAIRQWPGAVSCSRGGAPGEDRTAPIVSVGPATVAYRDMDPTSGGTGWLSFHRAQRELC
jgi:hypothetical protein